MKEDLGKLADIIGTTWNFLLELLHGYVGLYIEYLGSGEANFSDWIPLVLFMAVGLFILESAYEYSRNFIEECRQDLKARKVRRKAAKQHENE